MLVFRAGIHRMLVRIANRENSDQTDCESALLVKAYLAGNNGQNFRTLLYCATTVGPTHTLYTGTFHMVSHPCGIPGRVVQSVTCLITDAHLT